MKLVLRTILLLALAFFSYLMIRLSWPYTAMGSDVDFLQTKQNVYHIHYWRYSFYIHVFTSSLVLLAGFTQFSRGLLRRAPRVHRVMGWIYLVTVVGVSGPAAFMMGVHANGGLPARTSFVLLSLLWMGFTLWAGVQAMRGRFDSHRAFMIRSFALTLSALTLRVYTYFSVYLPMNVSPKDIYITTAWLSWVPNLIVADMIIRVREKFIS